MAHPSFVPPMLRRAALLSLMLLVISACHRQRPLDIPSNSYRTRVERPVYVVPEAAWRIVLGTAGVVPSLAILEGPPREWGHLLPLQYTINGFRADDYGCLDADNHASVPGTEILCPIHPYMLRRGENRVQTVRDGFKLAITRWDYLQSRSAVEVASLGAGRDVTFALELALPEWPWVHGHVINDTPEAREALFREVAAFHRSLAALRRGGSPEQLSQAVLTSTAAFVQASELRGKPYTFVEELLAAAQGLPFGGRPAYSVVLRELAAPRSIELFAGGTLARIVTDSDQPIIVFDSTLSDGAWGGPGPTVLSCDLWYRQDDAGKWVLDAVLPERSIFMVRGGTVTGISDDHLRELFMLSVF